MIAIAAIGLALPVIAAPASCEAENGQLGSTIIKNFANQECLDKAGIDRPK